MTKSDTWIQSLKNIQPLTGNDKRFSQFGEESFILHIFDSIGDTNQYFVDLGAGNGYSLSNTRFLKDSLNWSGLMVDLNNGGNEEVLCAFITTENVLDLLSENKVPESFDLLSIDIDGNDWYVLDTVLDHYRPRLIIAEFNGTIPVGVDKVIEYNKEHTWNNDDYYGASFEAFKRLGKKHGYTVVHSFVSTNIYLVSDAELLEPQKDWGVSYTPQQYHPKNTSGKWIVYEHE